MSPNLKIIYTAALKQRYTLKWFSNSRPLTLTSNGDSYYLIAKLGEGGVYARMPSQGGIFLERPK